MTCGLLHGSCHIDNVGCVTECLCGNFDIVDVDHDCTATDSWYYANQTQPSRNQPWYHVLVDGSDQVTYVAENNLFQDTSKANVTHPLLSYFFTKTEQGLYVRNENIWPGTEF